MIFDSTLNAWGEKRNGKFVPLFTDEEYKFRLQAVEKLKSGQLDENETLELQRECVRRVQSSMYSQARNK